MKWIIRDLKFVSKKYRKIYLSSTPLGDDYMREGVLLSKKRKRKNYYSIALFDKELIGWAMLDFFLSKNSKSIRTYIYVKTKYRRKGYGTKIINKAKQVIKKFNCEGIKVCPHDKSSAKFFRSLNITKNEIVRGYKY